jgi:glucosyl-3-phosphoglycerate phosphatase
VARVLRILIVRHAQSVWNAEGRWQGSADPPLSEAGIEQARAAGAALASGLAARPELGPVTSLWSSDLRRAVATAWHLGAAVGWDGPTGVVPDLREHDVGDWSGLTRAEIAERWPGLIEAWGEGRLAVTPGGETRAAFDARVRAGLASLVAGAGQGLAVVVSHGGVLRAIDRALGRAERPATHLEGVLLAAEPDGELRAEADLSLLKSRWATGTARSATSGAADEAV